LSRRHRDKRRHHGQGGEGRAQNRVALTPEGVPAAVPDAQQTSGVVFVSEESRKTYPWLPGRVIAGSVWRGPDHVRVQIDASGNAAPCSRRRPLSLAG
jgi:hypothetical protein